MEFACDDENLIERILSQKVCGINRLISRALRTKCVFAWYDFIGCVCEGECAFHLRHLALNRPAKVVVNVVCGVCDKHQIANAVTIERDGVKKA